MKIKTTVAALSVLSVSLFGAFAADSIDAAQAQNREAIGTVSVSGVASSPMDMREMLNKKAEEKGATAYQITEARSGDTWHATVNCTNKPSSSCPTILPPVRGLFFALMTNIKTQMPFQLFLCLIKQQY
ncbi:protein YcfR [Escherichia coli]|uniref:Protein YcfR n=1 Tax=Escherichia coli TaxID=562 RepID=A0A377C550_ECOLX|nr:protein YcfR [Escherichia coli]